MKPFYQKDGITIYCGKAEEIAPRLARAGTIVLDPPYTPQFERAMWWLMNYAEDGGRVLLLDSKGYWLIPDITASPTCHIDLPEIACSAHFGHPAVRPLTWIQGLLALTSGRILDPYMGAGSTLVAAKEMHREAVGIELEQKYCRIAVERLEAA